MLKLHGEHCQTKSNSICMYILWLTWMLSKLYKMSKNPQCPDMFSLVILVTILKMVCVAEKSKSLCQLCCNQILTQVSSSLCYSQMVTVLLWCFLHACFSFREIPGKDISKRVLCSPAGKVLYRDFLWNLCRQAWGSWLLTLLPSQKRLIHLNGPLWPPSSSDQEEKPLTSQSRRLPPKA